MNLSKFIESENLFKNFRDLNNNDFLTNYSKTKIENEFKYINEYIENCRYFENLFYDHAKQVNIDYICLHENILNDYFSNSKLAARIILDFISFISLLKENNNTEMQDRIIQAAKVFSPELITDKVLDYNNINDISESLSLVKKRYYDNSAPSLINDYTQDSFSNIFEKYNKFIVDTEEDPLSKLLNEVKFSEDYKKSHLVKAHSILKEEAGTDNLWKEISNGTNSELMQQAEDLLKDYNERLENLSVIKRELIKEDYDTFSYEQAKKAYKSSDINFGSTDDFLLYLKKNVEELFLIRNSIFKLIVLDNLLENKNILSYFKKTYNLSLEDSNESILECLNDNIESIVGHFIVFLSEKDLVWTNEVALGKAIVKFNKKNENLTLKLVVNNYKDSREELI